MQQRLPLLPHYPLHHRLELTHQGDCVLFRGFQPLVQVPRLSMTGRKGDQSQCFWSFTPKQPPEGGRLRHCDSDDDHKGEQLVAIGLCNEVLHKVLEKVQIGGNAWQCEGQVWPTPGQEGTEMEVEKRVQRRK